MTAIVTTLDEAQEELRGFYQHPDVIALFVAQKRREERLAAEHSMHLLKMQLRLRKECTALLAFMMGRPDLILTTIPIGGSS